jgi:hypothetical protein
MGTYYHLYFADYPVYSLKSDVEPIVMTIFRETDKRIYKRKVSERNPHTWGHIEDEGKVETAYEYSNTVANVKQRLEIMGFSLERARKEFTELVAEEFENVNAHRANLGWPFNEADEGTDFEAWLQAFKNIFEKKLEWDSITNDEHPLVQHILKEGGPEDCYLYKDLRSFFRTFIEVCPAESEVTLDITDSVENGYYTPEYALCNAALAQLASDYAGIEKVIVLTEGSTDKVVLEKSLRILYPHLYDYYSFMDFSLSNASGGASSLVAIVKAFIGSGLRNRIVALFDNDTAAQVARKGLAKVPLPPNIRVLEYPQLEIAKSYPTLGPSGTSYSNINGLACSIELYFGADILKQDGQLVPVHWKGYEASLNQYQGEILSKKELLDAFFVKAAKCESDPCQVSQMDWESMRLIFEIIFRAFNQ